MGKRQRPPKAVRNLNKMERQVTKMEKHESFVKGLKGMAAIGSQDMGQFRELVRHYAEHVVDPEHTNPVGIPDQSIGATDTGIITSLLSFDVPINSGAVSEPGRFGLIVSPTLGDSGSPGTYKVAMVDTSLGWPADLSKAASYVRNSGGTTLTVDRGYRMLLMPSLSYFEANGTNGGSLIQGPLGGGGPPDGTTAVGSWTINASSADNENPTLGGARFVTFPAVGTSRVTLPIGQWTVEMNVQYVGASGNAVTIIATPANPGSVSVSTQLVVSAIGQIDTVYTWVITVYDTAQVIDFTFGNPPTQNWNTEIEIYSTWARPDKLATPAPRGYPLNGGYVAEYVPVAMSVLATFMLPELTVAGDIAASVLAPNVCARNVFTPLASLETGNPLFVESNRTFPMAYDGKVRDGSYSVWMPSGPDDMRLRSPSDTRDRDWPCVCVSGKVSGGTGIQLALRVKVFTTYQYSTDFRLFPLCKRLGSTQAMEDAFRLLMTFPRNAQNGKHWDNIRDFFRRAAGLVKRGMDFYQSNKAVIDPALMLGASFI